MKIVVLDGFTLNPGDLSWAALEQLGDLTVHDRTPADHILARAAGAAILLTNKTPLTAQTIRALPDLQYIGVLATGYNVVDVQAAADRDIPVTNVPTYGTHSVAQLTFALLLELCHHVQAHSDAVRRGQWSASRDFCFWNSPLIELADKTIGIIGFGRIGRQVAQIADALGMAVLAADRVKNPPPTLRRFAWAEIPDLLANADVVSLHCPLFPETQGLINRQTLDRMKPSAFLLNTSRGPLIVEQDLADALAAGRIAGAAVDVLSAEPPPPNNPLLAAKNCLVTPHIAWATREARQRLMHTAVENLRAFLAGNPVNVVNR
ncbi:MAG: D-2-hydroxyacid dehydrogenase [Phycisphaerae bacterium]|nr:D-2-hydroxyacid dehydrogenase [Phycisphaerae bacterium]